MIFPANASKARFLGRVAALALLGGTAAGCSADIERFTGIENPFETTQNQSDIVRSDGVVTGSVTPAPAGSVTTGALPPPPMTTPIQPAPVAAAPAVVAPAPIAAAPATSGGEVYVVKPGDSLGRIANDRGLRSIDVATYNGIDPAAPIKVGQQLRIPATARPATQVAAVQPANTVTDAGGTLGTMPAPAPAQVPGAAPVAGAQPAAPVVPAAPQQPAAQQVAVAAPPQAQAQAQPQMPTGTGVESSTTGNFRWPVRGRVISGFGVKANGARNDGINIEVPEGTPIKASEGGTVIYAGSELKGYGNLVLVKHPNGMVSAYAHASELLVKRDDVVMRGQTLGKVGATGNVERPQLHFEIRQGNKPVDPIPYLSG
jgi:murein DD-endopeptidase MepM/ murein hydrolase activator NlpD